MSKLAMASRFMLLALPTHEHFNLIYWALDLQRLGCMCCYLLPCQTLWLYPKLPSRLDLKCHEQQNAVRHTLWSS